MVVYLGLALFPMILARLIPNIDIKGRNKNIYLFLCGFAIFLVMGLRHESLGSADTGGYVYNYTLAIYTETWERFYDPELYEVGIQFLMFVLSRITDEPQWLLIVTSAFFSISICYFLYHNSEDCEISVIAYICLGLMNFNMQGMRQAIAMSICIFAYEQAKKRHLIRFGILIYLAFLFHQTAVVFIIVYFLFRIRYTTSNMMWLFIICGIVVIFSKNIISLANDLFNMEYTNTVDSGGFIATAIYALILGFTLFGNEEIKKDSEQAMMVYVLLIAMSCYCMRYFGAQAAERVSFYFMFSQLPLLAKLPNRFIDRDRPIVKSVILILCFLLFAYRLNNSEFVPYIFYWQAR